ncbi:hypothetical protein GE061_014675 [Apolygus lucorum]|uniref:Uncharacterized protein n=1 Tax=Apolygus lucorum TaxID=248454 RepID=A0A8S9XIW0_APOLU|nr:hypothetical protein GE061_014675 [Apolygus lucorum]
MGVGSISFYSFYCSSRRRTLKETDNMTYATSYDVEVEGKQYRRDKTWLKPYHSPLSRPSSTIVSFYSGGQPKEEPEAIQRGFAKSPSPSTISRECVKEIHGITNGQFHTRRTKEA